MTALAGTPQRGRQPQLGLRCEDAWFVANTRWWPPLCMTINWLVAAFIVVELAAGLHFR